MTAVGEPPTSRQRGNIRRMRDRVQVRVSAGEDPTTGERIILTDKHGRSQRQVSLRDRLRPRPGGRTGL